ncbi:MAG: Hsp20 family protein [Alphaproteobacteria bacterium]
MLLRGAFPRLKGFRPKAAGAVHIAQNGGYVVMRHKFDFSPLFRSSVGFDRMARLFDSAMAFDEGTLAYPPYNIEKFSDESYRITMAVAGFRLEDLSISTHESMLIVAGVSRPDPEGVTYIHRGIAGRAFERRFQLADSVKVLDAQLEDGLLHIDLKREIPEMLKPRSIEIKGQKKAQVQRISEVS